MKITRNIKYNLIRLFRLKSGSHQVASGVMIGLIPSWLPTFGFGPFLSVGMARLVKANTVSALVGGVLGTFIWPLLFCLNYQVGKLLLERNPKVNELGEVEYIDAIEHAYTGIVSAHSSGFIFLTGAICNILISSVLIYIMVYIMFKTNRVKILNKIR